MQLSDVTGAPIQLSAPSGGPGGAPPAGLVHDSLYNKAPNISRSPRVIPFDHRAARLRRMRRRVRAWARWARGLRRRFWAIGVGLTYAPGQEWCPNDVRDFVHHFHRLAIAHAWVAELQARGAVHYHVILVVPRGHRIPKPDQAGLWGKGFTRVKLLKWRRVGGYLAEYCRKLEQKEGPFPRGLRLFAVGFRREAWGVLGEEALLWFRASALPGWLATLVEWFREVPSRRGAGGWWWFRKASVWVRSPWRLLVYERGWVFLWDTGAIGFSFEDPLGPLPGAAHRVPVRGVPGEGPWQAPLW